ncbi:hypothetical protein PoB_000558200 [Plakobranchus ocellatus]|uniref:Uncharacterized protein n=1 Tax=Plakobranchus ocellatus TaxID=259542 RepID=A0AAV3Y9D4_9GAST|nr:hypothetical protein PoB_000558200 [Plakobranchus ocellatus]
MKTSNEFGWSVKVNDDNEFGWCVMSMMSNEFGWCVMSMMSNEFGCKAFYQWCTAERKLGPFSLFTSYLGDTKLNKGLCILLPGDLNALFYGAGDGNPLSSVSKYITNRSTFIWTGSTLSFPPLFRLCDPSHETTEHLQFKPPQRRGLRQQLLTLNPGMCPLLERWVYNDVNIQGYDISTSNVSLAEFRAC